MDTTIAPEKDPAALARLAVETFVREGHRIKPIASGLEFRAACFVSIKTRAGDLRGCVGTIEPVDESLAEALITNAINAATRDPRFAALTPAELSHLRYSVDVLSGLEPTSFQELDPKVFGVVVEEEVGIRRGVLLPDIKGITSADQQVSIATRKAGILPGSAIKLFRFRVTRYRESIKD